MEDFTCPRCKTTKFQNPSLKLMVNVCGHALCESCVDLLFMKGSGACPDCKIPLRRNNFRVQLFEDPYVEKEVDIRKRVLKDFNKKEDDFATLSEYNDYLEEVENIIWNLANDVDVIETNKKIEAYKKENKEIISKNRNKLSRDEIEILENLEMEKQLEEQRRTTIKIEEVTAKKKKIQQKEALIDELMFSTGNAQNIVESFAEIAEKQKKEDEQAASAALAAAKAKPKATTFSSGIEFGKKSFSQFLPIIKEVEGPCYKYTPANLEFNGPHPPTKQDIMKMNFIAHIRSESEQERAGGFRTDIACMRALQDAMGGLFHVSST